MSRCIWEPTVVSVFGGARDELKLRVLRTKVDSCFERWDEELSREFNQLRNGVRRVASMTGAKRSRHQTNRLQCARHNLPESRDRREGMQTRDEGHTPTDTLLNSEVVCEGIDSGARTSVSERVNSCGASSIAKCANIIILARPTRPLQPLGRMAE